MIVTAKKILELNKEHNLIENLSEREVNNPEGFGFDLRLGEIYTINGDGYLGISDRYSPKAELAARAGETDSFVLKPGQYVLVKTIESVNCPDKKIDLGRACGEVFLMPDIYPRSTLQRCGVFLKATKTDAGYKGPLTFAMTNIGSGDFKIELGARFVNVVFKTVHGELQRGYEGQWNGGRVDTRGTEKQV